MKEGFYIKAVISSIAGSAKFIGLIITAEWAISPLGYYIGYLLESEVEALLHADHHRRVGHLPSGLQSFCTGLLHAQGPDCAKSYRWKTSFHMVLL